MVTIFFNENPLSKNNTRASQRSQDILETWMGDFAEKSVLVDYGRAWIPAPAVSESVRCGPERSLLLCDVT